MVSEPSWTIGCWIVIGLPYFAMKIAAAGGFQRVNCGDQGIGVDGRLGGRHDLCRNRSAVNDHSFQSSLADDTLVDMPGSPRLILSRRCTFEQSPQVGLIQASGKYRHRHAPRQHDATWAAPAKAGRRAPVCLLKGEAAPSRALFPPPAGGNCLLPCYLIVLPLSAKPFSTFRRNISDSHPPSPASRCLIWDLPRNGGGRFLPRWPKQW
jgi:hypothetical protein